MTRWRRSRARRGAGKFGVGSKLERSYLGEVYASKAEASYAARLDLRRRLGEIYCWERGPRLPLVVNGLLVGHYRPDFAVWESERAYALRRPAGYYVEVKGKWNEADRLRVRLFQACHPIATLVCVRHARAEFEVIPTPRVTAWEPLEGRSA